MSIPSMRDLIPMVLRHSVVERRVKDISLLICDELNLTEDERNQTIQSSNEPVILNRVWFASVRLRERGLISRPRRSYIKITELGLRELPTIQPNMVTFENDAPQNEVVFERRSPEEILIQAFNQIEKDQKSEVIDRLLQNSPAFFEKVVVTLLNAMGYGALGGFSKSVGGSGDGGIDGIIYQDRLGLDAVYIQAKRYSPENKVGRPALQGFVGALEGVNSHKGVFVTTSDFSSEALEFLKTTNKRVVAINGSKLVDLMIEHKVGVKVKEKLELHRIDEDFFLDE